MAKLAAEAWVAEEVRLAKEARALEKALVKTAEELVAEAELAERLTAWEAKHEQAASGYLWLHQTHVEGADTGADLDFLKGRRGSYVAKDSH